MKDIRYYAIGHSYLYHGPFDGWQTDGFWGMAATTPENDYFHKFTKFIEKGFDANVQAVAENHADFERCCTSSATRESLLSSPNLDRMKEVIKNFKPNVITILFGENAVSKDEKSLTLFFEVLYEMINTCKRSDTVVICGFANKMVAVGSSVAKKYGFVVCDCSIIHESEGDKYPYYAFTDYPEYDKKAQMGGVEFRTHPGDAGHEKIASIFYENAKDMIAKIPDGKFLEEYTFEKYAKKEKIEKFSIKTEPGFFVSFGGFNIRQQQDKVCFSSAPGTGASLSSYGICIEPGYKKFCAEMAVAGAAGGEILCLTLNTLGQKYEFKTEIFDEQMRTYEFDISEIDKSIIRFFLSPQMDECMVTVKSVKFLK